MELPTIDKNHMKGRATPNATGKPKTNHGDHYGIRLAAAERRTVGTKSNRSRHLTMLILDMDLKTKSVTFTQDSQGGTRTVLELCNPLAMDGLTPQIQR
jgi:hypothetical protein